MTTSAAAPESMDVDTPVAHPLQIKYDEAENLIDSLPDKAIQMFTEIIQYNGEDIDQEAVHRVKEHSIYKLGQLYTLLGRAKELGALLTSVRPFFATIPKAKTGKIVRTVIDMVSRIKDEGVHILQLQADLCRDSIDWCNKEKHTFLRQRVESRYASILFLQGNYEDAVALIDRLLKEIKKLDDKQLMVELHLTESRLHHALRNTPKAKAALTASRSIANSIYVVPKVQAAIDKMSGTLYAEERDYKTSYSYFFEAFEALNQLHDEDSLSCLKYMMLSKVASGNSADVQTIANGKQGMKYAGIDVDAMKAIAKAHEKRSLEDFDAATAKYKDQLVKDMMINRHLELLYENLLESNLLKIIEPFSCVEISRVAELIKLPLGRIESKLSQMILDHKFHGILDQGRGQLIVYDQPPEDTCYTKGLEIVEHVGYVVDSLFKRADHLTA